MTNTKFEITAEGGIIWQDKEALKKYLFGLPAGNYQLLAVKQADKRTIDQNSLLWRRYKQVANYLTAKQLLTDNDGEPLTVTASMVHYACKQVDELAKYLPKTYTLIVDESGIAAIEARTGTTTKLSRSAKDMQAFSDYYEAVTAFWIERYPDMQLD